MTPPYRKWKARQRRAVKLYRRGVVPLDIARRMQVGEQTVYRYLRVAGVGLSQPARRIPNVWPERRPAYWELHTRLGCFEVVCGRKFCPVCGIWRHLCDFNPESRRHGVPYARCQTCSRVSRRYYMAHESPAQAENRRERQRIFYEGQRREAGVPVTTAHRATVIDRIERVYLDPAPLLAEVERVTGFNGGLETLARASGVSSREIFAWRRGERRLRIDHADAVAVALGVPLALLYPEGR
jgi:hypothetical protein